MARKMKKFSAGGAQGRYDRRMADIEKDFKKNSAGKSGKALEVLEAKRMQRTADAKDDLAKRTGADRTATRAAEKLAESNLTKTRKYGAPQAVSKLEPVASEKITETLSLPKMDTSIGKKPSVKAADKPKPSAADIKRDKFFQDSLAKTNFKASARRAEAPIAPSKFDKAAFSDLKTGKNSYGAARIGKPAPAAAAAAADKPKRYETPTEAKARVATLTGSAKRRENLADMLGMGSVDNAKSRAKLLAAREAEKARNAARAKGSTPLISGTDTRAFFQYGDAAARSNAAKKNHMAEGGKVTKGKTMRKPAKAKAKPFAATKFGAAMVKKSADTKGRAMVKKAGGGKCYAKGGSIDGIAIKGKTKAKRVTMKKGGSC